MWMTPEITISHAISPLTARAARRGAPTASIPATISRTPHRMDPVEDWRATSTELCDAIETSSKDAVILHGKDNLGKDNLPQSLIVNLPALGPLDANLHCKRNPQPPLPAKPGFENLRLLIRSRIFKFKEFCG